MNLIILLSVLALARANESVSVGKLFISKLHDATTLAQLTVENGRLIVSEGSSAFDYGMDGSLALLRSGKYVTVNQEGKLVISKVPNTGFLLAPRADSKFNKKMSYNGDRTFQVCGDGSIGYKSGCEGSVSGLIIFEEMPM